MKLAALILASLAIVAAASPDAYSKSNLRKPSASPPKHQKHGQESPNDCDKPKKSKKGKNKAYTTTHPPTTQAATTQTPTPARDPLMNPCSDTGPNMMQKTMLGEFDIMKNVEEISFRECCERCWADPSCLAFGISGQTAEGLALASAMAGFDLPSSYCHLAATSDPSNFIAIDEGTGLIGSTGFFS